MAFCGLVTGIKLVNGSATAVDKRYQGENEPLYRAFIETFESTQNQKFAMTNQSLDPVFDYFYVARQPIFSDRNRIWGYEL